MKNFMDIIGNSPFPRAPQQQQISQTEEEQLLQMLKTNPQLMQKYQEELTKMAGKSKGASNRSPLTNKEYIQKLKAQEIDKYLDEQGGLIIQPDSAFVLKFYQKQTNEKIFVNIVKHQVVDHPEQKVLIDLESQSGLRIPMSMGRVKDETDKSGNPCKVVDVVFNPKIVVTAQQTPDILLFMAQIIVNYLLEKHKITISDQQMKKVKGLKYKGTSIQLQRVKGKKSPKIQQVSREQAQIPKEQLDQQEQLFRKINNQQQNQVIRPDFKLFIVNTKNKKESYSYDTDLQSIERVQILLDLSHLIHSKGIHLQAADRMILLSVRNIYELCLKIPVSVGKWSAKFSKKSRKLLIQGIPKRKLEQQSGQQKQVDSKKQGQKVNIALQNDLLYDIV